MYLLCTYGCFTASWVLKRSKQKGLPTVNSLLQTSTSQDRVSTREKDIVLQSNLTSSSSSSSPLQLSSLFRLQSPRLLIGARSPLTLTPHPHPAPTYPPASSSPRFNYLHPSRTALLVLLLLLSSLFPLSSLVRPSFSSRADALFVLLCPLCFPVFNSKLLS